MYTYPLDLTLLPKVIIYWKVASGMKYLNCQSGKLLTKEELEGMRSYRYTSYIRSEDTFYCAANSKPSFVYLKYHEDTKLLEVAQVTINTSRKEVARNWEYVGGRYFVTKDKTVYDVNGNIASNFVLNKYETLYSFPRYLQRLMYMNRVTHIEELCKLIGSDKYVTRSGRAIFIEYSWHFKHWFETNQPKKPKTTKAQKLLDEVSKIELSKQNFSMIEAPDMGYHHYRQDIVYFEKVNDDWCVFRLMQLKDTNYVETNRVYISKYHIIAAVNVDNEWISCRKYHEQYNTPHIINPEAMSECQRIKYITEGTRDMTYNEIVSALRFPELEQLSKLGGRMIAKRIINHPYVKAELKHSFGDYYNDKEKSLSKKTGMSKQQFAWTIMQDYMTSSLRKMHEIYGADLSHYDLESFKKMYTHCNMLSRVYFSDYYFDGTNIDKTKFFNNLKRLGEKYTSAYQVARDTLSQYRGLNAATKPEIDWYFDNMSDLTRAHDAITALAIAEREERAAFCRLQTAERHKQEDKKREELDKKRKEWEYEDDQYIIRLPHNVAEIVTEGSKQRICIGGYTTFHSCGHTNLFFLRKKSDPDTPFYAIEMGNDKSVRQIHGYCNKWLGCNPEAIPTVVRWMRKNDIKCAETILTCTSTGYGRTNNYIAMPKVD